MPLKICIVLFLNGFKDSIYGCVKFFQRQKLLAAASSINNKLITSKLTTTTKKNHDDKNKKLYQRLFESCILNGVFLLACMLSFNYVLMPILNWIYFKLLSPEKHNLINIYLNPFLQLIFSFVWILPVFILSKIFNLLWHQEIADIAYIQKYETPQMKLFYQEKLFISQVIADTIFSCTLQLIFLIQSSMMSFIPMNWLNQVLCHIHLAFLYSLYAFEYKWCNMGWDIQERIDFIETRWPYHLGFGLSLSCILSFAGSYIYSATLFAFIFPAFILSAIESNCENQNPIIYYKRDLNTRNGFRAVVLKLPLFRVSLKITDFVFKIFEKRQKKNVQNVKKSKALHRSEAQFTINKTN